MKYYVMINGQLVEAKLEHIQNLKLALYDEGGVEVRAAQQGVVADEVEEDEDIKNLTAAISALTEKVNSLDVEDDEEEVDEDKSTSEVDDLKAQVAELKVAMSKGFPISDDADVKVGEQHEILDFASKHYDIKKQGMEMWRKSQAFAPGYQMSENGRIELVKYFTLVALASKRFATPDSIKAMELIEKYYGQAEDKTVVGDTGNVFPVPDIVDSEIFTFAREASIILQYSRIWDMTSEKQSFPMENAAVSVNWGNTTQESEPGITEVELDAEELSAYSAVRNTTLADARSDIVSWLGEALAEAAGLELDNKGFNGLGTDDPFICSGILSAACGYSVALASGSTAFSQVSSAKLSEMISKLDGLKKAGARFWLHGEIIHFVRSLVDDNNRPIFIETVGAPMSGTIWGYPYTEVIKCPSTTGANTAFLAFGNLRYFATGRRLGATSLDVNPYLLWTTNRTAYKLYQRWGMAMGLPNGFVRLLTAAS